MGQLVLKLHCMWGGQKDTGLQEYFVRCQFPESIANGLNEAMLVITVESDTGSSDTGSFSLSDIDSTATRLLEHCQDSNVDSIPFPWTNSGTVS